MIRRRLAAVGILAVLLGTAACSMTATRAGSVGVTTGPTQLLTPLQGSLSTVALPTGVQSLQAVDCPTAVRCWAVGSTVGTALAPSSATVVTTKDGGATWKVQNVPSTVGYLAGIACTSVRACTAVGQVGADGTGPGAILSTQDGGSTWTLQPVPAGTTDVTAIACAAAGTCMALADVAGRVTALSTATPTPPPTSTSRTSPATTSSTAPAGGWVSGGALPATVSSATGLTCTDTDHCWATVASPVGVGHAVGGIDTTTDGGTTWLPQTLPAGTGVLQGIDCTPSTTVATTTTTAPTSPAVDCVAVGTTATGIGATRTGQGTVLTSTTGGVTWSSAVIPTTVADLSTVSCGAGPCVAVGTSVTAVPGSGVVLVAKSAGAYPSVWSRAKTDAVPLPLTGVSCTSLSACVVVGESMSGRLDTGT
jgi:hypothetical protein